MKRCMALLLVVVLASVFSIAFAINYCPYCGANVSNYSNIRFCPYCSALISDGEVESIIEIQTLNSTGLNGLPVLSIYGSSKVHNKGDLPVYTGPGMQYYRSSSGKAAISNSQSVDVYGKIGTYLLVQYHTELRGTPISRFAYAPIDNVSNGESFPALQLGSVPIRIASGAKVVDEPDASRTGYNTIDINFNTAVALALIYDRVGGTWVYFESTGYSHVNKSSNVPVRGFTPLSSVTER